MVRDNITGLVWEIKNASAGTADYNNPHDADNQYTWYDENSDTNGGDPGISGDKTDTLDFINAVNDEQLGGFSDWRMPTREETRSIVNLENYDPVVDTNGIRLRLFR